MAQRGCAKCAVRYETPDGRCPLCGKVGVSDLRGWKGSMPPSRKKDVWIHPDSRERLEV